MATFNTIFHSNDFVFSVEKTNGFGGPHDSVNEFGASRLQLTFKQAFPTSVWWLYHVDFVDIIGREWAVFDALDRLSQLIQEITFVAGVQGPFSGGLLVPECTARHWDRASTTEPQVDLFGWTCGVLEVATSHARLALSAHDPEKTLRSCELMVKEYSRRFGMWRTLVALRSTGLWRLLHAVHMKVRRRRLLFCNDTDLLDANPDFEPAVVRLWQSLPRLKGQKQDAHRSGGSVPFILNLATFGWGKS